MARLVRPLTHGACAAARRLAARLRPAPRLAAPVLALLASALAPGEAAAGDMSGGLLPVPSETIARGERITAGKLTEKHFYYDPDRPLSVLTDPREAVGRAARRTLVAGRPIPQDAVRRIALVRRGRPTEARFLAGNLVITTTVLPQADGGPGELVRARNVDSGRIISGIVAEDGAIEVQVR